MRYHDDYKRASIPTFPSAYGYRMTRVTIAISSVIAALAIVVATRGVGLMGGYQHLIALLSGGLLILALGSVIIPSERINFGLFKYASFYMLSAMLLLIVDVITW
jgi:heme O synthase-like polyprenyltransferase